MDSINKKTRHFQCQIESVDGQTRGGLLDQRIINGYRESRVYIDDEGSYSAVQHLWGAKRSQVSRAVIQSDPLCRADQLSLSLRAPCPFPLGEFLLWLTRRRRRQSANIPPRVNEAGRLGCIEEEIFGFAAQSSMGPT